jgi:ribonuclease G
MSDNNPKINKSLFISSSLKGVQIALLEEKKLVELHEESGSKEFAVGDVYLGKIKKLNTSLNAVFVDVGYERDGFLHYFDLGPQYASLQKFSREILSGSRKTPMLTDFTLLPDINKNGKISDQIQKNQSIVVQVLKEPISTKGPRITCDISFAGRYVVLVPFSNVISISKKIRSGEERKRLKTLIQSVKPRNFGVIVRTAAEEVSSAELDKDIKDLVQRWQDTFKNINKAEAPKRLLREINRTSGMLRDLLNDSFDQIVTDDVIVFGEIKAYLSNIAPDKLNILKLHKNSKQTLFDVFGIDKQIQNAFGSTVTMGGGSYLIIEHTEAMHVIDVNSGSKLSSQDKSNRDENVYQVNVESAAEIARQLRLRDMGGIIVIDFIDMKVPAMRQKLQQEMQNFMANDRAKHTILPISKFGLMQITRERVRPEVDIAVAETCPDCGGTGKVRPTGLIIDQIEENLQHIAEIQNEKGLKLHLNPFVAAYLTKGIISTQIKWLKKYKTWIKIIPEKSHHLTQYHFVNKNDAVINL